MSFGKEYTAAVESKQVAQQEAQRAAFFVERAKQERQQKIVQAEGEAEAAKKLGEAVSLNPGYLKLRKIRAAQSIARTVSLIHILPHILNSPLISVILDRRLPEQGLSQCQQSYVEYPRCHLR